MDAGVAMTTDSLTTTGPSARALLVLPRVRVQNANTISGPLTWGFPAVTAFTGLMSALERRFGPDGGLSLHGVGVICHGFDPQVTRGGFERSFHLARHPVLKDGSIAAIVEEGRAHLDITLVFDAELASHQLGEADRAALAALAVDLLGGMRVAGGSVMPQLPGRLHRQARAQLHLIGDDEDAQRAFFDRLKRRWLPGFALVSRDDLLHKRLAEMRVGQPTASVLDAWLDLACLTHRAERHIALDPRTGEGAEQIRWQFDQRPGWIVPIPIGYTALDGLHPAGTVARVRDERVPFRFVESVYSLGEWVSPHRLGRLEQLFWRPLYDGAELYRCFNDYQPAGVSGP